jgi:hypothetical protein
MSVKTEGRHAAEFVLSEGNGSISRDNIVILSGAGVVVPGTVLGKISVGDGSSAAKSGGNTGDGTFVLDATAPVKSGAKVGVYTLRCYEAVTNGGKFRLEDPDGLIIWDGEIAAGAGGTVTVDDEIKGVLTDGDADFIVGDGFDITVAAGSAKYVPSPNTGVDGSESAVALNLYEVDATSADQSVSAIVRDAEVNKNLLTYEATVDDSTKEGVKHTQLAAVGIIVR